mmetsp:Transcript_19223/g.55982  ORF Transcript_19223/g.55982 Transcript_19223/m.55982 type:complete len:686 (-) Transcript_19223:243-2300(-)
MLSAVQKPYLVDLCRQCSLPTSGSKPELLARLREYASAQAREEADRRRSANERKSEEIESGFDEKGEVTKHKIAEEGIGASMYGMYGKSASTAQAEEEDDDDDVFYFRLPSDQNATSSSSGSSTDDAQVEDGDDGDGVTWESAASVPPPPPPADVPPNEDGERVVTVYSTSDRNDLTAAGAESLLDDPGSEGMKGGYARTGSESGNLEDGLVGGPFGDQSGARGSRGKQAERETDEAKEKLNELVGELLATTGMPAFRDEFMGDDDGGDHGAGDEAQPYASSSSTTQSSGSADIRGFDPTTVPATLLTTPANARALRHSRGAALAAVLREAELRAVGYDDVNGDDLSRGGGHYREVRKVGAFLEGYRRAEVRRSARGTAAMLLDRLVQEGVRGLDLTLATMSRGDGVADVSEWGADGDMGTVELNDALLEYLDDAIRQQERKVERVVGSPGREEGRGGRGGTGKALNAANEDATEQMWESETDSSGDVMDVIDPNDPEVRAAVKADLSSRNDGGAADDDDSVSAARQRADAASTPPEKLLLLLACLRDRVKAEAAFGTDERGRNLRVLARVLHAPGGDPEREDVLMKELGSSLDRLDSFLDLLGDALEYAESNAERVLQPGALDSAGRGDEGPVPSLDMNLLKRVRSMAEDARDQQAWRASGVSLGDNGGGMDGGGGGEGIGPFM